MIEMNTEQKLREALVKISDYIEDQTSQFEHQMEEAEYNRLDNIRLIVNEILSETKD